MTMRVKSLDELRRDLIAGTAVNTVRDDRGWRSALDGVGVMAVQFGAMDGGDAALYMMRDELADSAVPIASS
jgi:hypothetical protein